MDHTHRLTLNDADIVHNGDGQDAAERRSWYVIWLCVLTTVAEIAGGWWSGSIALVADGLHTSTHAAVLTMAALAYRYARRHDRDPRFAFGTGKVGDLAGFSSAVVLAVVALLILWEAADRLVDPVPIGFSAAIGLAALGLVVNVISVWLLRGGVPDRVTHASRSHRHLHRDNNMRAIVLHIVGDGAVSILVICGLLAARASGALWLDPAAGIASAAMVLWLAYVLIRDTGAILLDFSADTGVTDAIRRTIESDSDRVADLHVWRIGPGRLGAVLTIVTDAPRQAADYRTTILALAPIAQLTIEVQISGAEQQGKGSALDPSRDSVLRTTGPVGPTPHARL